MTNVSILIPTYQGARHIAAAIDSVLAQDSPIYLETRRRPRFFIAEQAEHPSARAPFDDS